MFRDLHFAKQPFLLLAFCFLISLSSYANGNQPVSYQQLEWTQLMPADDLDALLNPPESLYDIEDGSEQDDLDVFKQGDVEDPETTRYLQALSSSKVIAEFDQKAIRIPGFIVPLTSNAEQNVTEFFIVPYFGACLHMPPPPPNQIIYSTSEQGIKLDSLYEPFWFEGTLVIESIENSVASSAYRLQLNNVAPYEE
ncbi:DUF3299 domain-containing protein [Pseudoalteromonas sp. ZZD1]|uniref:DUF3299 domain-containing protein n=1 Tax=Pseudoalteromonas sp. ZZD1 TaxID=3139395 RepID=UPI003BAC7A2E